MHADAPTLTANHNLEVVIDRYAPMIFRRCRRSLGSADADDATQAVFVVLSRKLQQAPQGPALSSWLLSVADFVVRNALRDQSRRDRHETAVSQQRQVTEESTMDDIRGDIDACLAKLPADEREAVRMHHLGDHTLSDIAKQLGIPISTVHDRVQRGLSRLRALLIKRGIHTASPIALVASFSAESQAAIPETAIDHLRILTATDGEQGAEILLSDRVQRWSREQSSVMSRVIIAAAALLLIGGGAFALMPLDKNRILNPPTENIRATASTTATATTAHTPNQKSSTPSEKHISVARTRLTDGPRLWQRLSDLPEGVFLSLLPEEVTKTVGFLRSIKQGELVCTAVNALNFKPGSQQIPTETEDTSTWSWLVSSWLEPTTPESLIAAAFRNDVEHPGDGLTVRAGSTPDTWITADSRGNELLTTITATRIARQNLNIPILRIQALPLKPSDPQLDAVAWMEPLPYSDGTMPSEKLWVPGYLEFTVSPVGVHFNLMADVARKNINVYPEKVKKARVDPSIFTHVPPQAVAVCGTITRDLIIGAGQDSYTGPLYKALTNAGHKDPQQFLAELAKSDGHTIAWVAPGFPFPTLTIQIDMSKELAERIIAGCGSTPDERGHITIQTGSIPFIMGWNSNQLVITSNLTGPDAIDRSGGFLEQPEIKRSLVRLPQFPYTVCILVQPTALSNMATPYLSLALPPEAQKKFGEYRKRLELIEAHGYFVTGVKDTQLRAEASGSLVLFAPVIGAYMLGLNFPLGAG